MPRILPVFPLVKPANTLERNLNWAAQEVSLRKAVPICEQTEKGEHTGKSEDVKKT